MRMVVVSENLSPPLDDGVGKFAWSLGRALQSGNDVRMVNVDLDGTGGDGGAVQRVPRTRTFQNRSLGREVRESSPDAVVYLPAASSTVGSFVRSFWLRRYAPQAAHGMVALMPRRHGLAARPFLRAGAPDVLFVPSRRSLLYVHSLSLNGSLVPLGVDPAAFHPPEPGERSALRQKHGVTPGSFVYLFVGALSPDPGIERLVTLARQPGATVIAAAGLGRPVDLGLRSRLDRAGVRVFADGVAVAELYRLADGYVFPREGLAGEVELPFGVFEALASGLPVVSTPFGGLRDFLQPGDDLRYFETDEELEAAVSSLRERAAPSVRAMDDFCWVRVAGRIARVLGV